MALIVVRVAVIVVSLLLIGAALWAKESEPTPTLPVDEQVVKTRPPVRSHSQSYEVAYPSWLTGHHTSFSWDGNVKLTTSHSQGTAFDLVFATTSSASTTTTPTAAASNPHARHNAPSSSQGDITGAAIDPQSTPGTPLLRLPDHVEFRALWLRTLPAVASRPLFVYIYSGIDAYDDARRDFEIRTRQTHGSFLSSIDTSAVEVRRGTLIDITPSAPGIHFEPARVSVQWRDPWHCVEFRMKADDTTPHMERGTVSLAVGPVMIAEIPLRVIITADDVDDELSESAALPYRKIFVSYSRKDVAIVEQLERAYTALGENYLRDVRVIRSGQRWEPRIYAAIREADVFQLCWSESSKRSQIVRKEWRYASRLKRDNFIRPIYWQTPMPRCPAALQKLHFAYYEVASPGDATTRSSPARTRRAAAARRAAGAGVRHMS